MLLNLARELEGPASIRGFATTGRLSVADAAYFTIEQPWNYNIKDRSCVPPGVYELIPYQSPAHGPTWCLHNPGQNIYGRGAVPNGGRTYCEIHSANWAAQLLGCIALGLDGQPMYDPSTGLVEPAVEDSRDAYAHFLALLGPMTSGHLLTITQGE